MKEIQVRAQDVDEIMKEIFWLAWNACRHTFGMGYLQDHPEATKDQVFHNVLTRGDYPGGSTGNEKGLLYADYVFGRMMKLNIEFDKKFDYKIGVIRFRDDKPRTDYQAWCRVYPTYEALVTAAIENVLSS